MSALYLTEEDVAWLLDINGAIESVEDAFRQWGDERAEHQPRRRVAGGHGATLHVLSAGSEPLGYVGYKSYVTTPKGARFQFGLFDAKTGQPVALIEANLLGQMRTGAASGVATKFMARPDAKIVGCFGTGFQAKAQLKAVCSVRRIERIEVYGRDDSRRRARSKRAACFLIDSTETAILQESGSPSDWCASRRKKTQPDLVLWPT